MPLVFQLHKLLSWNSSWLCSLESSLIWKFCIWSEAHCIIWILQLRGLQHWSWGSHQRSFYSWGYHHWVSWFQWSSPLSWHSCIKISKNQLSSSRKWLVLPTLLLVLLSFLSSLGPGFQEFRKRKSLWFVSEFVLLLVYALI